MERILEFSGIEMRNQGGNDASASWPSEVRVEIQNLEIEYATDMPSVLHDFTLAIEPRQRVGVVGRTGA